MSARPRASVTATSTVTRCGTSGDAIPATTRRAATARRIRSAGDAEADELGGLALVAGLDLEDVFAGGETRERHIDLLLAVFRRRLRLQLVHRRARAVEEVDVERRRRAARTVGRHPHQEVLDAVELAGRDRHRVGIDLDLLELAGRTRAQNGRRAERGLRGREIGHADFARLAVEHL